MRAEARLPDLPTLPDAVALRWHGVWGEAMVAAAARAIAAPPPLDLSFKDAADPLLAEIPGASLLPGHLRRVDGGPVMELPGFDEGRRSEENPSELQSLMRISYADLLLK